LKFTLTQDGFVTVSGHAKDESEHALVCRLLAGVPLVEGVISNMNIHGTGGA